MIRISNLDKKNLINYDIKLRNLLDSMTRRLSSAQGKISYHTMNSAAPLDISMRRMILNRFRIKTSLSKAVFCGSAVMATSLMLAMMPATSYGATGTASTQVTVNAPLSAVAQDKTSSLSDEAIGFAAMEPRPRPHFADAWGGEIVEIELPHPRPSLLDMLPQSTRTLSEMVKRETGKKLASTVELTLSNGDTLAKILKKANFTNQEIASVSSSLSNHLNLRKLQVGTRFTAGIDDAKAPVALQIHLPQHKQTRLDEIENGFVDHYVLHDPEYDQHKGWMTVKAIRPVEIELVHAGNQIDLSLYNAAKDANIPLEALDEFVTVMGFSVDFQREIRQGDSFELVFQKSVDSLSGEVMAQGKLHYAGIVLSGKKMGYFRYVHANGRIGWYDRQGQSAVRTLMRTPINGARISSGFGMRRHPTKGFNAMHRGVDFAVPKGTPILAAGSGHIDMAGWNGSYGKFIRIRHNSTYDTAYAHLSGIAAGIRRGVAVEQGQVIGYVGSTGRSTGPHLHYEILVNNRKVNPLTVKLPTGKSVPDTEMAAFRQQVRLIETQLSDSTTPQYAGISFTSPVF